MIRILLYFFFFFFLITKVGFAQDSTKVIQDSNNAVQDSAYYSCVNCSNPLFLHAEIIKEKNKLYIVHFNKADNPFRINNKEKEVHCVNCDNHSGFEQEDGTLKIIHSKVYKNGNSYDCSVCKKPLVDAKDLTQETQETYIFKNENHEHVAIANRSYILVDKNLYCSFCYEKIGKSKGKDKLKILKNEVIKP